MTRLVALLLLVVVATACGPSLRCYDYTKEPDPRRQEYVIGPADVVRINVWNQAALSQDALTVRPDGTITMPLIGDLQAAGRTPSEIKEEIAGRLRAYIKEEVAVTVAVTQVNSYRFTVSGNVERGGTFGSQYYVTVAEAVALAGGPNRFSSPESTVVIRMDRAGRVRKIPVDLNAVNAGKCPEMTLVLMPGDRIYVP